MKIMVINGPNLNLLGEREPEIYGKETYDDLSAYVQASAKELGTEVVIVQSNHEGVIIDEIHRAKREGFAGIVINPAAYTHTSVAIMDAISAVELPLVEVHLSNTARREEFRHTSFVSKVALGTIMGFGMLGYKLGIEAVVEEAGKRGKSE